ncbi:MAG: dGTP triphosphohydrolase [Chakrabartia sp.]
MSWSEGDRRKRQYNISKADQRKDYERDRDRILYSSAFHRLAGITQIVRAGELDIFHTRQQHTYKVAQVGRRLAQHCIAKDGELAVFHGVDQEVVEAACLAHDLGHPPFGHAAEKKLDLLVTGKGVTDGYEGNAQTFRILTKLAVRYGSDQCPGLDLTRATLAACLKYPWIRDVNDQKKTGKWSAYETEKECFDWTREFSINDQKTAEAEIMDWADDIAYSVHDLEDFHRVGIIPWAMILSEENADNLVNATVRGWFSAPADASAQVRDALSRLTGLFRLFPAVLNEKYDGSRDQRHQLRNLTSQLIGRYVRALSLAAPDAQRAVSIDPECETEVRLLKHVARQYVIGLPALHAQQFGQAKIISDLFDIFFDHSSDGDAKFLPMRLRYIWKQDGAPAARLAADCVAALTEGEAYALHRRLTGAESGSVLDPIVR